MQDTESLVSGTSRSSGWKVAVTLASPHLLSAGNGRTAQVRSTVLLDG